MDVAETSAGVIDFALHHRCKGITCSSPVSLVMNNRLLVVATSGEVGEGARVFHWKVARHEWGALDKRCKIKQ